MARQRSSSTIIATACLVISVAACGQGTGPASAPPTSVPQTNPPVTVAPTVEASRVPVVTQAPLPVLDLLWEATADTATNAMATYSPAIDPLTGDIWVAASFEGIIWIVSEDGEYKGSFGKLGKGEGEFNFERSTCRPCGAGALAFAPDGTLFVADTGNNRIQKFSPKHKFVREWGTFGAGEGQFADATQIATDGESVFVGDDARQDIQVFDMDGKFLRFLDDSGWLAVDPTGNLLVSHEGTVTSYDPGGARVDAFELPDYQGGFHIWLAVDDRGRLFFNFQNDETGAAIGLGALDPSTGEGQTWADSGESVAISGNVIYEANYAGPGWPAAALRAYSLPE